MRDLGPSVTIVDLIAALADRYPATQVRNSVVELHALGLLTLTAGRGNRILVGLPAPTGSEANHGA